MIQITDGITRMPQWRMKSPVNFSLSAGQHIAIVGPNGGGKSMLVDIITGAHPLLPAATADVRPNDIRYITFRDSYGTYDGTYYLQQRWNQTEIDDGMPTVGEELERAFLMTGDDTPDRRAFQQHLYDLFSIRYLLDSKVILMSSGETRKFQLIKALLTRPSVLVMDNPFIGLDADARGQFTSLLSMLSQEQGLQIILVLSKTDTIPAFITHMVIVDQMEVHPAIDRPFPHCECFAAVSESYDFPDAMVASADFDSQEIIQLRKVTIRYGQRVIMKDLDWTVHRGEHWALEGQNGSGKSTLLSLVCADNPQAYACDISLFGHHRRQSSVSIWDIKKHIGYVSPEMHRAYQRDMPLIRIVASGLYDSVGLYITPKTEDYERCRQWMRVFGIEHLADKTFLKVSSGEQRLALLARAFVKSPDLLILDEPLHGLDHANSQRVKDIINAYSIIPGKTLVMVTHYQEELPPCIDHHLTLKRIM